MTREEKIAAIYKEMANKELTFGCKCKRNDGEDVIFIRENRGSEYLCIKENEKFSVALGYTPEIIGHPVMIGDVLDWIGDKRFYCGECRKLVDGRDVSDDGLGREYYCDICNNDYIENTRDYIVLDRDKKRLPIDEQSDECINYVYSLIQKD